MVEMPTSWKDNSKSWLKSRISAVVTVAFLSIGWCILLILYNSGLETPCGYTNELLIPLLLLGVVAFFTSAISTVKHSRWWILAGLCSIFLVFTTLGTFEGC